jgi:hypothetical protein
MGFSFNQTIPDLDGKYITVKTAENPRRYNRQYIHRLSRKRIIEFGKIIFSIFLK